MRKKETVDKILDVDASMQGNMVFKDPVNLRINGTFEGGLDIRGNLMIGENAVVKANIKGEFVTIAGSVYGDITVTKSISIVPPARVIGNLRAPSLSIAEGAIFEGNSHMIKEKTPKSTMTMKDLLTIDEVARYLEVDKSLILSWAAEGKLPGVKEKDTWKFERARLDDWVANEKIR
jgi:excisionase family DNA binding protein